VRRIMTKDRIDDVIADGMWRIPELMRKIRKGKKRTAYIAIGRPRPDADPRGDWICPIQIESFISGVKHVHGIGPLDALLNAMNLLRTFFDMNTVVHLERTTRRQPTTTITLRRVPRRIGRTLAGERKRLNGRDFRAKVKA